MNTIITDRIEIRSIVDTSNKKRYVVKGTALMSNKQDIYEYNKNKDGSYKVLKSIFTPNCLQSIKKQAEHKKLFVDVQHELACNSIIRSKIKGKLSKEDIAEIEVMLKIKKVPIAKITDIDLLEDRLDITTELNPMFREIDDEHKNYFDAVWYSLENKFLNGISVNLGQYKYAYDEDENKVIDDIDILGFSYVDSPANIDNSIYEVAMRVLKETGGKNKMENDKTDEERIILEQEKQKYLKDKEEVAKLRGEIEEEKRKLEIEKQKNEQKNIERELLEKTEELKRISEEKETLKKELTSAKGLIKPGFDKYSESGKKVYDEKFFTEKLNEITAEHRKTMEAFNSGKRPLQNNIFKGFGELVQLQAQIGDVTIALDEKDAQYIKEKRLLDIQPTDIITPSLRRK